MKKILLIKICIITLCTSTLIKPVTAQNDADPAVTSLSFAISPLEIVQETGLTVFVTNGGFTTAVPAGSIGLSVSLPPGGEYAAFPESVAALSGDYFSKFNWSYNAGTKTFTGILNQDIAPGDGGTIAINIKAYIVVTGVSSSANIILLDPPSYPNDNTTNNSLLATLDVTPGGTLPINLLSFNATRQNNVVNLFWETASEANGSYFEVQTNSSGTNWKTIGIVQAVGNSNTKQQYSFIHNSPVKGINYYRLKMVDIDAKFGYSLTRTVAFSTSSTITILPNPTTDKVYIASANSGAIKSVEVYSTEGKLMQHINNYVPGSGINLYNYTAGVYLLKIIYKDETTQVERVVKQ